MILNGKTNIILIAILLAGTLWGNLDLFQPIDIRKATNMGFTDEVADDQTGGWTDQGSENDMKTLSPGLQELGGVPFDIIDAKQNEGTSCIVLRGEPRSAMPLESPAIQVMQKGAAIYFAGTCAWSATPDEEVLRLVVTYKEDTSYSESAFVYGQHMGAWWRPEPLPLADVAYEVFNGVTRVGFYSFAWVNPYPDKTIADIKFISADTTAVPIIVAATLLKNEAGAAELVQQIQAREESLVVESMPVEQASIVLERGKVLRSIPPALVSVANGSSTSPEYAGPAKVLLEAGHQTQSNAAVHELPGRPFYRIQTHAVEPSLARGVWDFTQLDRVIDAAVAYGAEPMISLSFPPKWFFSEEATYTESTRLRKPYDIEAYAEHCAAIVRHYTVERPDSPVLWWEIGNEVELHDWSYAYYIKVYSVVAQKLREVDARVQLGGPVTAGPNTGWAAELLRVLPEQVDFISYHQYGYSEPFETRDAYIMGRTSNFQSSAKRYRDVMDELSRGRDLPLFLTESNTSWRYHEGTDPRIRNNFGAAWIASALGQYVMGGGDVFCYFTLNGGFGSIWSQGGDTVVFPAWHTLWLYREYFKGDLIQATSDVDSVEAYGWESAEQSGVIIVNKNDYAVDLSLTLAGASDRTTASTVQTIVLNETTYQSVREVDPSVERGVRTLQPTSQSLLGNQLNDTMQPFEVRVLVFK